MLQWHFVLHNLPEDTPYARGQYHGKLVFPEAYPLAPPSLTMLTPSGRLETGRKLCLSMTDFHPETWNPAWTVESILLGLISFMVDPWNPRGIGTLQESAERRRQLAASSCAFNRGNPEFTELFPEPLEAGAGAASVAGADLDQGGGDPGREAGAAPQGPRGSGAPGISPPPASASALIGIVPSAEGASGAGGVGAAAEEGRCRPRLSPEATGWTAAAGKHDGEECWICRVVETRERLIRPCACRGSMSSVHASCVEMWVNHHRACTAGRDEAPRCSVCKQPYSGTERQPGFLGYARHLCFGSVELVIRRSILAAFLCVYWIAAQSDLGKLWLRVPLFVLSGGFFLSKAAVLAASLVPGPEPRCSCLRILHTNDERLLGTHIVETAGILFTSSLWSLFGIMEYYYVLALGLMVVIPALSVFLQLSGSLCSWRSLKCLAIVFASPLLGIAYIVRQVWADPWRLLDASDGLVHCFVPVVSMLLVFLCPSSTPVLVLWALHAGILLGGVVEKQLIGRLAWKEGRSWWVLVKLSALTTYVANLVQGLSLARMPRNALREVLGLSSGWLLLCCVLALAVNWQACVGRYRAWQQRNATFALSGLPGSPAPQTLGVSGMHAWTAAPPAQQQLAVVGA